MPDARKRRGRPSDSARDEESLQPGETVYDLIRQTQEELAESIPVGDAAVRFAPDIAAPDAPQPVELR